MQTLDLPPSSKVRPMTKAYQELTKKPTISSQLPLVFHNGHVLKEFKGSCSICGKLLDPKHICGTIVQPFENVAIVEALGLCRRCNVYVPLYMRYKDDGRIETRDASGNWMFGSAEERRQAPYFLNEAGTSLWFALAVVMVLTLAIRW